ncbi:putative transcription factor MADS-type1 family [Medicago truncatula]|nr:putative transcription factor MADS-type1 family [Medicago truncatula]
MKKINEISTLCGVEACAIISEQNSPQVEVWPSDSGVRSVISRFRSLPGVEQSKKMVDQEVFLRQTIGKVYGQLKKQRLETRKKEMTNIIDHYIQTVEFNGNSMSKYDLNDFSSFIDENLKEVDRKMKEMTIKDQDEVGNEVGL